MKALPDPSRKRRVLARLVLVLVLLAPASLPVSAGQVDLPTPTTDAITAAPDLTFATFIGGPVSTTVESVAVDALGNVYVTGYAGKGLPVTRGPADGEGAFVGRLAPDGATVEYLTYVGKGASHGDDIAVLPDGTAYVVGEVDLSGRNIDGEVGFPTTPGALKEECVGDWGVADIFLIKLRPDGETEFSTCLDNLNDYEPHYYSLALDAQGNALIGGDSYGWSFPFTAGMKDCPYASSKSAFAMRVDAEGKSLIWAGCFVGSKAEYVKDVASLPDGTAYLLGDTSSSDFPHTGGSLDPTLDGDRAGFLLKMSPDGQTMQYGTFIDRAYTNSVATDAQGAAWITGSVALAPGQSWYITLNAFDATFNGYSDTFIARLAPNGSNMSYATFLGGKLGDIGYEIAVDDAGAATVFGGTASCDFPTTSTAASNILNTGIDAFVARLSADQTELEYGTFLGGTADENTNGLALFSGQPIVVGQTRSLDFPTTPGVFDAKFSGSYWDGYVVGLIGAVGDIVEPDCAGQTVEIKGKVSAPEWNTPLIGARVSLMQRGNVLRTAITQPPDGRYSFPNVPELNHLQVRGELEYAATDPPGFRVYHSYNSSPKFVWAATNEFSAFDAASPLEKDVRFEDAATTHAAPGIPKPALPDLGMIYHHSWEAFQYAAQHNLRLDLQLPLTIRAFSRAAGVFWSGPRPMEPYRKLPAFVNITEDDYKSDVTYPGRPDNREYHEIGHHVLADLMGNALPLSTGDVNHAGHTNPTTTDAWTEGFAEFYSLNVGAEIGKNGRPGMYKLNSGAPLNLEVNYADLRWYTSEELSVAGLLWDLIDPEDQDDATVMTDAQLQKTDYADCVAMPVSDLWQAIQTDWWNQVDGPPEAKANGYGYIYDVKQLYDVLKHRGVGQAQSRQRGLTDLDELFIAHGFFADLNPMNAAFDVGETVGLSGYHPWTTSEGVAVPARLERRDVPEVRGSHLAFTAKDEKGGDAPVTEMHVDVVFAPPFEHYSYSYTQPIVTPGRVYYYAPDSHYAATTRFAPQASGYVTVNAFTLTNDAYWSAMAQAPADHFATAAFVMKQSIRRLYLPLVVRGGGLMGAAADVPASEPQPHTPRPCTPSQPPAVLSVEPNSVRAGSAASITVYGLFEPAAVAFIDQFPLDNLAFLGAEPQPPYRLRLQGNLPAALGPGVYDVTVRNPDGRKGQLPSGFTILPNVGPTITPSPTGTATSQTTPTRTATASLTVQITTPTPSATPTLPVTLTPSGTPSPSPTRTNTPSPTPNITPSSTWTSSPTPTRSATPTRTPEGGWQVIFSDGFEGDFPASWLRLGNPGWGRTSCRKSAGNYSVWPAADGTGYVTPCTNNYPNNVASWMIAGPFDLSDANDAEFTFRLWQQVDDTDAFAWLASYDGIDFDGYEGPNTSGWTTISYDLEDYVGLPEVWIAFYFASDSSGTAPGAWVDDVVLRKK